MAPGCCSKGGAMKAAPKKSAGATEKCPGCGEKVEKKVRAGCKTMKCPSCGGKIPVA